MAKILWEFMQILYTSQVSSSKMPECKRRWGKKTTAKKGTP